MKGERCIALLIALIALPAAAADLETLLVGEMAQLKVPAVTANVAAIPVTYADGSAHTLGGKQGKVLLVNLWSKGCVPCKKEMPDLARLQQDLGGDLFEVVALTMEKRSAEASGKILADWGAGNLAAYGNDPQTLARALYDAGYFTETKISFSYPTTYLVNKAGDIVAVREGYLRWDVPEARALITALMED